MSFTLASVVIIMAVITSQSQLFGRIERAISLVLFWLPVSSMSGKTGKKIL